MAAGSDAGIASGPEAPTVASVARRVRVEVGVVPPSGRRSQAKVPGGMKRWVVRWPWLSDWVVAEWKPPVYPPSIKLATSSVRRNSPMHLDSKIHHNNLLNNILAKIEANYAGADAGLMLDTDGYVAEANGVNVFCIHKGVVLTPHADYCLPGITRRTILRLCKEHGIPHAEKRLSLTEFYTADEVFTTGTMGELTRVESIDGRAIINRSGEQVLEKVAALFRALTEVDGVRIPTF